MNSDSLFCLMFFFLFCFFVFVFFFFYFFYFFFVFFFLFFFMWGNYTGEGSELPEDLYMPSQPREKIFICWIGLICTVLLYIMCR